MKNMETFVSLIAELAKDETYFIYLNTANRNHFNTYLEGMYEVTNLDEFLSKIDAMFTLSVENRTAIKNEITNAYEEYFEGTAWLEAMIEAGMAEEIEEEIEEPQYIPPKSAPVKEKSFLQGMFKKSSNIYIAVAGILIFVVIITAVSSE